MGEVRWSVHRLPGKCDDDAGVHLHHAEHYLSNYIRAALHFARCTGFALGAGRHTTIHVVQNAPGCRGGAFSTTLLLEYSARRKQCLLVHNRRRHHYHNADVVYRCGLEHPKFEPVAYGTSHYRPGREHGNRYLCFQRSLPSRCRRDETGDTCRSGCSLN